MSANNTWKAVDSYIVEQLLPPDLVLDSVLQANKDNGLPAIDVSPPQGKMLHIFVKMVGARKILEFGTLGGYSTIWMARAMPEGGRLITLEYEPHHAEVARSNIARAGLENVIDIRVGAALDTLPKLETEGVGPFDLIFIDADKPNNPIYLEWALKLSRPGTVIICDNIIRNGAVIDVDNSDARVGGARGAFEIQSTNQAQRRLTATAIQTVGSKGYDGFTIAIVN